MDFQTNGNGASNPTPFNEWLTSVLQQCHFPPRVRPSSGFLCTSESRKNNNIFAMTLFPPASFHFSVSPIVRSPPTTLSGRSWHWKLAISVFYIKRLVVGTRNSCHYMLLQVGVQRWIAQSSPSLCLCPARLLLHSECSERFSWANIIIVWGWVFF